MNSPIDFSCFGEPQCRARRLPPPSLLPQLPHLRFPSAAQQTAPAEVADKYLYLEEVSSPKALEWVKDQNARTAKVLEADPRFAPYAAEALKIAEDPQRLPDPEQHGRRCLQPVA